MYGFAVLGSRCDGVVSKYALNLEVSGFSRFSRRPSPAVILSFDRALAHANYF
jgi:hypothetical protein